MFLQLRNIVSIYKTAYKAKLQ